MICPECRRETSNEQAFCSQCGAYVRSQFGRVLTTGPLTPPAPKTGPLIDARLRDSLDDFEWADIEAALNAGDPGRWPQESVFIPNFDEELKPAAEGAAAGESDFDDEEADDVFEQSLSGSVKREDVLSEIAEAPVTEEMAPPADAVAVEPESFAQSPVPAPVEPAVVELLKTNPNFSVDEPVEEVPPPPVMMVRPRSGLLLASSIILPIAFFVVGVAMGLRLADYQGLTVPDIADVPPVAAEPARPTPPRGMAYVPGGDFLMGSDEGDTLSQPPHFVRLEPFFIGVTEVSNRQYGEFVQATGQVPPPSWKEGIYPESEADFPVTGVTWYEAAEYAAWKGMRLPTEAEWEFAARGTDGRAYPWGDEWDASLANVGKGSDGLRPVGQGGVSPFGLYDMSGNAWEWTSSDARSYPAGKEFPRSRMRLKIIRGGNWQSGERSATTFFRGFYGATGEGEYNSTSFRCVKDIQK